ncbi:hypothetical protein [Sphaerisporangium sp. NPDC051011]|uniref:hypothetical protein n=1 Tax=Sphaerisporangium sp. NPDC051011 TaxID=3155792 RepID=UPI0033E19BE5
MRTSFAIKGVVALAVVAGAGWAGAGSALAAVPCGEGTLTPLTSPTTVYCGPDAVATDVANGVTGLQPPRLAERTSKGDLVVGIEQIGRSPRLLSGTTAVIGLADLPAVAHDTGVRTLRRGLSISDVSLRLPVSVHRKSGPTAYPYQNGPAATGLVASDVPDAPGLPAQPGLPVQPVQPEVAAKVDGLPVQPVQPELAAKVDGLPKPAEVEGLTKPGEVAVDAETKPLPAVGSVTSGLRVR